METRKREEWEIKEDARTLAVANEIQNDKLRYKEATEMASKMAKEQLERIEGLLKISKKAKSSNDNPVKGVKYNKYRNAATIKKL